MTLPRFMKNERETNVEKRFVKQAEKLGWLTLKLNVFGRRGWPDRLVLMPGGRFALVEFKRKGERLRPLQEYVHGLLKKLGHEVLTADDADAAVSWCASRGSV